MNRGNPVKFSARPRRVADEGVDLRGAKVALVEPDVILPVESGTIEGQSDRGFHVHYWVRGGMSFWVVSDLNNGELTQFVEALQASP